MRKYLKLLLFFFVAGTILYTLWFLTYGQNIPVMQPKGVTAAEEWTLIKTAVLLMLVAVIPFFALAFFIIRKYREGNDAAYTPDWGHNTWIDIARWGGISAIIFVLAVITWGYTHRLDPYRPLDSAVTPLTVQVVALDWKWLFIYPEEGIATVNFLEIPEKTPIHFLLSAEAPMNSFWIPQLSGQIYTMAGMTTQLHLMANEPGDYHGRAAEINGRGFAGMQFDVRVASADDFAAWVGSVKSNGNNLTWETYKTLAEPSENVPPALYASTEEDLYNKITMQFMPAIDNTNMTESMNHSIY